MKQLRIFITKNMDSLIIFIINLLVTVLFLHNPTTTKAQQPAYRHHECPNTTTTTTTYQANRNTLLSSLSSNSIHANQGFFNTTVGTSPNTVYGLFLCRGDFSITYCRSCVALAADDLAQRCPVEATAVIWYDECLLRYSDSNIFAVVADGPTVPIPAGKVNSTEDESFKRFVLRVIDGAVTKVLNEPIRAMNFAINEEDFSSSKRLYVLVQCTPDITEPDCVTCLRAAVAELSDCCISDEGGRILSPSCNVRYEFQRFYNVTAFADPTTPEEERQNKSNWIPILGASLSAIGLVVVSISCFFIWRRRRKSRDRESSQEAQLLDLVEGRICNEHPRETFNGDNAGRSQEFSFIQLDILHEATNHFSNENKLGEGGFGPVYKGTLADGKEIAVKRLSRTSGQGLVEFKNEIVLIAKLQHRNLVKLLGCCLEKNEKLLVYEFLPNKSLDVFLFDSNLATQLDWPKRFNIIKGIARGILYLHEDSRLRIIHRDLKVSNVLLDHEMNPKISDFGMARIFGEDKNEAKTNRVVGTYGYMAPEYAMQGLFSIKSDVFSFGVLLLEIISGKKNNSFHLSENGEILLTFAWKLWSKGEGMELIDKILVQSCVASEVLKCIHIGLLCVQENPTNRPTMSSVIVMLASDSIMLPYPTKPAFFVGRLVVEPLQAISNGGMVSFNEITVSNLSPRS